MRSLKNQESLSYSVVKKMQPQQQQSTSPSLHRLCGGKSERGNNISESKVALEENLEALKKEIENLRINLTRMESEREERLLRDAENRRLKVLAERKRKALSQDELRVATDSEKEMLYILRNRASRDFSGHEEIKVHDISKDEALRQSLIPVAASDESALPPQHIPRGSRVRIKGLRRAKDHNGRLATVLGRDDDNGVIRYELLMDGEPRSVSVNHKNLELVKNAALMKSAEGEEEQPTSNNDGLEEDPVIPNEWNQLGEQRWKDWRWKLAGSQALMQQDPYNDSNLIPAQPEYFFFKRKFEQALTKHDAMGDALRHKFNPEAIPQDEIIDTRDEFESGGEGIMCDDMLDAISLNDTLMTGALNVLFDKLQEVRKNNSMDAKADSDIDLDQDSRFHQKSSSPSTKDELKETVRLEVIQNRLINQNFRHDKEEVFLAPRTILNLPARLQATHDANQEGYGLKVKSATFSNICRHLPQIEERVVRDSFADPQECLQIVGSAIIGLLHEVSLGAKTILPVSGNAIRTATPLLSQKTMLLVQGLRERVRRCVMKDFNVTNLYHAAAVLERTQGWYRIDKYQADPGHVYWNPHIDKAQIQSYDYSTSLHLTSRGLNFNGGREVFVEKHRDVIVEPVQGRLLSFTAGPENLHRVERVENGTCFMLKMYFTTDKKYAEDLSTYFDPTSQSEIFKIAKKKGK